MFNCAFAYVLPEPSDDTKTELRLLSNTKHCPSCKCGKELSEFHTKGANRHEHICKACSNSKKNKKNKYLREKNAAKKNRKKCTKTISVAELEVIESKFDGVVPHASNVELLLQDFIFDFQNKE